MKVRFHYETIDDAMKTMFEPKDWDDFCKHLTNKYWDTNEISCKLYYDKPDRRIGWEKTWIIKTKVYNPSNPSIPFVYIPIAFSNGDITKLKGYKEKMRDTQLREKKMIQTLINDRYKMIDKINTIICSNVSIEELTTTKLNVTCNNKGNFQPTDKSKSQGSLLYHPFQSFINKVKKLITK